MPSKFKPTRQRKRKVLARDASSQLHPSTNSDSNATIVTTSKPEHEEKRRKLREEIRSQQPKVSAQKQKRLDKYIEKKLRKDETADLVRKLEKEKDKYDPRGLTSSKHLKRKFEAYVNGQALPPTSALQRTVPEEPKSQQNGKPRYGSFGHVNDDEASVESFEEENKEAFDPDSVPYDVGTLDDTWLRERAPPTQGTGLAKPLQIGADGMPIIPVRNSKRHRDEEEDEEEVQHDVETDSAVSDDEPQVTPQAEGKDEVSWEGFSTGEDQDEREASNAEGEDSDLNNGSSSEEELDPRLRNIDAGILDELLAELENSDASDESIDTEENASEEEVEDEEENESAETSNEDSDSGSDSESSDTSAEQTKIKPRTSSFKSWATQQVNQSMGHTPFYDQLQPQTIEHMDDQIFEKPAAGYKVGVQFVQGPKPGRQAYTVNVQRAESIQETRLNLPILQREQEIMEAIHNNPVVVVKGDTGSGKTTQLPQFLFESGFGDKSGPTPGMIGITQPRRVAAVSMAKRVAEELGNHGDKVAHQIRFDTTVSSKTAVKFMTDGILLRELSQDLLLKKYSAIIIDEAHERSVNTDILIGMLSKIVPARSKKTEQNPDPKPLKLVIMSATLNINDFLHEKLFTPNMKPPIIEAEGRQHRVTTHFALRSRPDYVEEIIEKVKRAHRKLPRGGMLVFLTGQNEIKNVLSQLRKDLVRSAKPVEDSKYTRMHISATNTPLEMDDLDLGGFDRTIKYVDTEDDIDIVTNEEEADKEFEIPDDEEEDTEPQALSIEQNMIPLSRDPYDSVHILPLYSQLPTKEQLRIFEPPPDRARLIVLATNVAETSLTIPGIRYVFDSGRSKERKFDTETNIQTFEIDYISKASAQQRAGRAGRTGPGHCWRLYSSAIYEQYFPDHTVPEILRTPAENVVLQLKGFRYPRPVVDFPFPSPPSKTMLEKAEQLLRHLGAISGPNGALTELGKKLSLYPLSPRLGKVLINAIKQPKILQRVIMLAAALSVDDVFINETQLLNTSHSTQDDNLYTSANQVEDEERDRVKQQYGRAQAAFSKHDKTSDAVKVLTAVQMYLDATDKDSFCEQFFLRPKGMHEISQLFAQLRSMVRVNHPELADTLKATGIQSSSLKSGHVKGINTVSASGYIDQIALRYDLHPTPPILPRRPTRAIDIPYLPLSPLNLQSSKSNDIIDRAVFLHPSSLLSRLSVKSLPEYIVYRHLQTSQAQTITSSSSGDAAPRPKTRMFPLTPLDANTLLSLVRDTGLIVYGKPVPKTKIEDVSNTRPKERICWVSTEVKTGVAGAMGWPLPPSKVKQVMDLKSSTGWRVVEVLA